MTIPSANVTQHTNRGVCRVALVTGAAGALGLAVTQKLVARGYYVILADVDRVYPSKIPNADEHIRAVMLDVTNFHAWETLRRSIQSEFGELHCLVQCAGTLSVGEFWETDWQDHQRIIDVNLTGTMLGCRVMIPLLKASEAETHLINTASYTGFVSSPWSAAYNASKAGVISLSETLHTELQSTNINVSVVCPAYFPSRLLRSGTADDAPVDSITAAARRMFERSTLTADQVADAMVGLIDNPQFLTILPAEARRAWRFKRFFPRWFLRFVAKQSNRLRDRMQSKLDTTS